MKRRGSSNQYFIQRIPADVKPHVAGTTLNLPIGKAVVPVAIKAGQPTIRVSLRTSDAAETKTRQAAIAAHLENVWQSFRDEPRALTQKQTVALAGEVYKRFTAALEENPGDSATWQKVRKDNRAAFDGDFGIGALLIGDAARKARSLEDRFGPFVDLVLGRKGIRIDDKSRFALLQQVGRAMDDAAEKAQRNAEGDYRPDTNAARFPEWADVPKKPSHSPSTAVTMTGLFDAWKSEVTKTKAAASATISSYGSTVRRLVAFLKHDDALAITRRDIVAFKDARLAEINPRTGKTLSGKTVNDVDLAALKTIFGWAVKNDKLPSSPATGINVSFKQSRPDRERGFTDAEAVAILHHAMTFKPSPRELPKTAAAKRWVPWICAYTGARVGEIVQLRKEDVRRDSEAYTLHITPEAGTVKGGRHRDIPLHPHLVELGFPAFVKGAPDSYLFFTPTANGWRGTWEAMKNRLREFVREVIPDPQVQPNHGWRHRFITLCRKHGVDAELRRMITGHKGQGIDESGYGDPAGLYREICKLPKIVID